MPITQASIVTYSEEGSKHSNFSALAGYTNNLVEHFKHQDGQIHAIFSNIKGDERKTFTNGDVHVIECWKRGDFFYWLQILKEITKHKKLKIIHLQHEFNLFGPLSTIPFILVMIGIIKFILGKKVVITLHEVVGKQIINDEFLRANNLNLNSTFASIAFHTYYTLLGFFSNSIIVHDKFFADILTRDYGVKAPVYNIAHGIEDSKPNITKKQARKDLGIEQNSKMVLFMGFLAGYKGLDLLLDGFKLLPKDQNYQLVIAGGQPKRVKDKPEYKNWYKQFEKKAKSMSNVKITGFVHNEDIQKYFVAADLMTLPYLTPQSMSGIMSLAVGYKQAFIASDSFKDRVNDLLLFEKTPKSLSKKILDYFTTDLHEQIIGFIEETREQNLWVKISAQTLLVYNETLNSKSKLVLNLGVFKITQTPKGFKVML